VWRFFVRRVSTGSGPEGVHGSGKPSLRVGWLMRSVGWLTRWVGRADAMTTIGLYFECANAQAGTQPQGPRYFQFITRCHLSRCVGRRASRPTLRSAPKGPDATTNRDITLVGHHVPSHLSLEPVPSVPRAQQVHGLSPRPAPGSLSSRFLLTFSARALDALLLPPTPGTRRRRGSTGCA
jgi:hypothetical protein